MIIYGSIYCIENTVTKKRYVGKTTLSVEVRLKRHIKSARSGSSNYLHRAIMKYGEASFTVKKLADASAESELNAMECEWISTLNTLAPNGYNLHGGGEGGLWHPSSRLKLSKTMRALLASSEGRAARARSMGNLETRRKMSAARKAFLSVPENRKENWERAFDPLVKARRRETLRRVWTKEKRESVRLAVAEKMTPERRERISSRISKSMENSLVWAKAKETLNAIRSSDEYRKRMSESAKRRWALRKSGEPQP